nr:hypothetical protein [Rappaport israeli]
MAITIYPPEAFAKMRVVGRLAADVLDMITPYVVAGVSTESLDTRMQRYIEETQNAVSACLAMATRLFPKPLAFQLIMLSAMVSLLKKHLKTAISLISTLLLLKRVIMATPVACLS